MQLMTLGYEGLSLTTFLDLLHAAQVEQVIDVRQLPLSRKKGFSKRALAHALTERGIKYEHLVALGCPRDIRVEYRQNHDWIRYTRQFVAYLKTQDNTLKSLIEQMRHIRCCLICFEADYQLCHRSLIAKRLSDIVGDELIIKHLKAPKATVVSAALVGIPSQ